MFKIHSFIAGLCAASLCTAMITAHAEEDGVKRVEADTDSVRPLGRTYFMDDTLWLPNSASGVEFTASGSKAAFELTDQGDPSRIGIFVNGELRVDKILEDYISTVEVELDPGENTVRFIKLSEAQYSTLGIDTIVLDKDAKIAPTKPKQRKLEFVGDSITCGYGVDMPMKDPVTGEYNKFSTDSEDVTKTYAYLTAEYFDADINIISASGYGVYCGYSGKLENTLTNWYERYSVDVFDPYYFSDGTSLEETNWDFSLYQPDCIVLNLGTNDWLYLKNHDNDAAFEASYNTLLTEVRQNNPNAVIICTVGLMGDELFDNIENAVNAYKEQTADEKIYTIKLNVIDPLSEGEAISGHPTEVSNRRAAETELIPFLENIMNWQELPEEPAQDTIAVVDEIITDEEVTDEDPTDEIEQTVTLEEDISNSIPETVEIISSENHNSDEDSLKPDSLAFKILMGMAVFTVFGGIILLAKLRK